MLFGLPEMKVFAETSSDPRIKTLWSRLEEARKKNALWCDEVNKLRGLLRWRKWPEESPSESGFYLIGKRGLDYTQARYFHAGCNDWDVTWKKFYWMPQMPLPEVES